MKVDPEVVVQLPAVRRFSERIRRLLSERLHVVVAFGCALSTELREGIVYACLRELDSRRVDLGLRKTGEGIPAFFAREFALDEESAFVPGGNHSIACDVPRVIELCGYSALSEGVQEEVMAFLAAVARLGWAAESCLLVPVKSCPEIADARLSTVHFWGELSLLEVRLLCREAADHEMSLENQWREAILPEVAGADLMLVEALWDVVLDSTASMISRLQDLAVERGWNDESARQIREVRRPAQTEATASCPPSWAPLWRVGAAYALRDAGSELSSVALAWSGRTGDESELVHRIWRGQTKLVYPVLDEVRRDICLRLTELHGRDWPIRFHTFKYEEDRERAQRDPLATEYGPLVMITRESAVRGQKYHALAKLGRDLRNDLAHYQPIEFCLYKQLVEMASRAAGRLGLSR